MAHDYSKSEQRGATTVARGIELGWTVYDAIGRPVGTVSDVSGDRLRIDGRPEGLGAANVPLSAVREAGANAVHLTLRMEDLNGQPDDYRPPPTPTQGFTHAGSTAMSGVTSQARTGSTSSPSHEQIDGSSYTASGTPVGVGSNTPVGEEPDTFRSWDRSVEAREGSNLPVWLAPAAAAAAGFAGYLWWRRRQFRRDPLERALDLLAEAGDSAWGAARERHWAWWLAPLAAVPLAWYLRSSGDESTTEPSRAWLQERSASGSYPWQRTSWRDYLPGFGDAAWGADWVPSADVFDRRDDRTSSAWLVAIPAAAAAAAAAWYAFGDRKRPKRRAERLADIMTRGAQTIHPDATLFEAASTMRRLDVGALPVCDGARLQGMITDRDIALRAVAEGRDPHLTFVRDAMTSEVVYAFSDDPLDEGAKLMRKHQIRRLPIVDDQKHLVGIVSLGDLAVDSGDEELSGKTLKRVSTPARPSR